ncbi:endonuclease III [Anaerococcus porci]|uniref:Endonuclease III n=1 Tax=Anaerococcus porci TaxID=2652269 RepID=A0A6N7VC53_9FIRM|nr:endonuclease III [Anaerococcus porci]MDY3007375.1 endonuclease III [Anaerococcus porci]MSS76985.1 endonuclease III [Anaerococcus porci]
MRIILEKEEISKVIDILNQLYPNLDKSFLDFTTPFELLVATILSAQCTDVRVNKVTKYMFKIANKAEDFANMNIKDIEDLIKTCGLYKNKAKNIKNASIMLLREFDGKVPDTMEDLIKLPGVGRKTANVVMANAFNKDTIAVDTHVQRVSNRIGLANSKNVLNTEKDLMKNLPKDRWSILHHQIIAHGRKICKARNPLCHECDIRVLCEYYKEKK